MTETLSTASGPITIRAAVPADAAELRVMRLEALERDSFAFSSDVDTAAQESVQAWAERIARYASAGEGQIQVALSGDRYVGMVGIARGGKVKVRHNGWIWGAYVRAAWRGLHIGEALLNGCVAWARAQELAIVKLGVAVSNTPAIRCYARCGFAVYGIEPKASLDKGVFIDELLMAREP
ncbi:MAG: GNAT family N-acetyltransferase [Chloroflexi bacterium]|nr:GNAT family N-acetyltransferase [Chloroflexota bacterium]